MQKGEIPDNKHLFFQFCNNIFNFSNNYTFIKYIFHSVASVFSKPYAADVLPVGKGKLLPPTVLTGMNFPY